MKLEFNEQQAINDFLSENWDAFVEASKELLTEEECEELGNRLAKNE